MPVSFERICVIDTYVILHNILHKAQEAFGEVPEGFLAYAEAALEYVDSLAWFPGLAKRNAIALWAVDSKPYWRSHYYPGYKGVRLPKPSIFGELISTFNGLGLRCLEVPGYEADDVAAAVVQLWRNHTIEASQIFLATVDSDWQGLACQPDIFWVDVGGHTPRVRQTAEIYQWTLSKWKKQSAYLRSLWTPPCATQFKPQDIWSWKIATGDTSDALPPYSPRYLIDLFNPLPQHRLWEKLPFIEDVRLKLDSSRVVMSLPEAEHTMSLLGLLPPISPIEGFNPQLFNPVL